MLVTVNNITNPAVSVDAGTFGLLAPGASKTLSIQAAVFESVSAQISALASKGYVTFTVAEDPGTPPSSEVISAGLGGQLASPYGVATQAGIATGATIGVAGGAWTTATHSWPTTGFYASGATPTGAYATGSYSSTGPNHGLFYLSSGAANGITAGMAFQNGPQKSMLLAQVTGAGSFSLLSDNFPVPTTQVAQGTVPAGSLFVNVPLQPGANFQLNLTSSSLVSAELYKINS